jgi:phosphoglycolate phosphatase-like HAD superfamily hydrolase
MKRKYQKESPIYFGDTLKDKESAEKAGWRFVWVTYGWEIPPKEYPNQASSIRDIEQTLGI